MITTPTQAANLRHFRAWAVATVLFGLALRVLYVSMVHVEYPIRGDVNQYVLYAWNLSHRGTFSSDQPDAAIANPDSYRGPGFPALLAASMLLAGHADLPLRQGPAAGTAVLGYQTDTWMRIALGFQVLLGTLTIALAMLIARQWLAEGWVLLVGALVAVWPHLVVFAGVLLSETLFGFLLVLSIWLYCSAQRAARARRMALAGLSWGAAYLVNPVVALFPLLAAALCLIRRQRSLAFVLLGTFAVLPAAWAARNATQVNDAGALRRLEENFVQGSWPQYHAAQNSRFENTISRKIIAAIDAEIDGIASSPGHGLVAIGERFAVDPGFYLAWYFTEKPYLLWDWSIRVGAGDIYFLATEHSPFAVIPLLAGVERTCKGLNPLLFALACAALLGLAIAALRRQGGQLPMALLTVAVLSFYLTLVHVALQAEPRYSVPYRPLEMLLAVSAVAWVVEFARGFWRTRTGTAADPAPASRWREQG